MYTSKNPEQMPGHYFPYFKVREMTPICVTGMHRSGTSMVTRLLNLCGMYLGSEDRIMPSHSTNSKGFWENLDFVEINQTILEAMGVSWDTAKQFKKGWYDSDQLDHIRLQAYHVVKNFSNIYQWGWKDPRTSLTLRFWKQIMPNMKVLICLRNPIEVALSLQKRNYFTIQYGLNLWWNYNKMLFSATNPEERIVTHYETFFRQPGKELNRIVKGLGLSVDKRQVKAATSTISSNLWHNRDSSSIDEKLEKHPRIFEYYQELCLETNHSPYTNIKADNTKETKSISTKISETKNSQPGLVSIIIPVFNKLNFTRNCLQSLIKETEYNHYEIIVIDNASTDDTAYYLDKLSKKYSHIKVIFNATNQGFARASNQGAQAANGEYLLFLNNDTKALAGWLQPLVNVLENDPDVAAVGSKLLFPDNTIQHAGVIIEKNNKTKIDVVGRHIYYKRPAYFHEANQMRTYPALTAASLMIRSKNFWNAEGFDESYWNGYEDIDLCFNIGRQGGKLVYQPSSVLIHYESQSGPERFSKINENVALLQKKWKDKIQHDAVVNQEGKIELVDDNNIGKYNIPNQDSPKKKSKNKKPLVSIVILTWNALEYTKKCFNSIHKNTSVPYEIIFVDNNSSDGTQEYLKKAKSSKSNIKIILNEKNNGFAAGNNQGMQKSEGEYIVLLNNDVLVSRGWLQRMVRCARTHSDIGLVGPLTNRISGTQMISKVPYKEPQNFQQFAQKIAKQQAYKYTPRRRIAGFAMLIKRKIYEEIGDLDENFGTGNYEDDDFCVRVTNAGYKIYVAEDTFIHHFGSRTFQANQIHYQDNLDNNGKLFREKWPEVNLDWLYEKDEMIFQYTDRLNRQSIEQLNTGKYDQAKLGFRDVLEADPINTDALFGLSIWAETNENYDTSIKLLKKILNINPSYYYAYNLLGKISFDYKRPERAYNLFKKALSLKPDYINARRNLGVALTRMGKHNEALQVFEEIIKEFPEDRKSLQHLITLHTELDNTKEAHQYAEMIIRKDFPSNPEESSRNNLSKNEERINNG
ncbi:MAG TPA: glycosyltransferase [bacterium]|nr:glycosyltransferase [bacterium]